MIISKELFECFLPKGICEWFEITEAKTDESMVYITLQEKDDPPLSLEQKNMKIIGRKFHDITITDFPLRGRRTLLTFRRRYWKLEGQTEYLKRDIALSFPGTQLAQEFANFLKEDGGRTSGLARFYRRVSVPLD